MNTFTESPPAGPTVSPRPYRLNPAYGFIAPALALIAVFAGILLGSIKE